MAIHVIDQKKVDMTADEFEMYQKIVKSYTTTTNKGEELFQDLFETDDRGIILFLKPPTVKRTSFEVYLFLMSLFEHQHMRILYRQVEDMAKQIKEKMAEIDMKLAKLQEGSKK